MNGVLAQLNSWPSFERDEVEASARVLASGKGELVSGVECRAFEREFADYVAQSMPFH